MKCKAGGVNLTLDSVGGKSRSADGMRGDVTCEVSHGRGWISTRQWRHSG